MSGSEVIGWPFEGDRLPENVELEMALLGALLVNNRMFDAVVDLVSPEHFADPAHEIVYRAMSALIERGQQANATTLRIYLERSEELEDVGGVRYLGELAAGAMNIIDAPNYARAIRDLWLRRSLIGEGSRLSRECRDIEVETSAEDLVGAHEDRLFGLTSTNTDRTATPIHSGALEALQRALEVKARGGGISGLSTGLTALDGVIGGIEPGDLVIIGGRPGMGKTALVSGIARANARAGTPVGLFSLEMARAKLARRELSGMTGIALSRIRRGDLDDAEIAQLQEAAAELDGLPIYISDTGGLTPSRFRAEARRLIRRRKAGLFIVDNLQLMSGDAQRYPNKTTEVTEISGRMKQIALSLEVPVILISHLSRAVEQREDKRPQLSDLRESGSIEQDADAVLFLYREAYYHERNEPQQKPGESDIEFSGRMADWSDHLSRIRNKAEVLAAKVREDASNSVAHLYYDAERVRFGDWETRF